MTGAIRVKLAGVLIALLVISADGYEEQRVSFAVDREPTKDLLVTLRKQ